MKKNLYIFGGDSTALEIHDAASSCCDEAFAKVFFVVPASENPDGEKRISIDAVAEHVESHQPCGYVLSMTDPRIRKSCIDAVADSDIGPISVIHPSSCISPTAQIGKGVYIAAFAVVSANAVVEPNTVINFQAIVGHHSCIGTHSILNPGAKVGGHCQVGKRVLIGAGAFLLQGKSVGDDSIIDAMTYVDRDLEAGHLMSCRNKSGRPVRRPFFTIDSDSESSGKNSPMEE